MKTESGRKVKTGIFVLAGLGIALVLVFLIGSQQNLFQRTFTLFVNYRNVVGLKEGAFVRFNGINAAQLTTNYFAVSNGHLIIS